MENTVLTVTKDESITRYKRQRFMSCPAINDATPFAAGNLLQKMPIRHKQSIVDEFTASRLNSSQIRSSKSEPTSCLKGSRQLRQNADEIGVRIFADWRPRRNSFDNRTLNLNKRSSGALGTDGGVISHTLTGQTILALNEEIVLTEMNVDTKLVLTSQANQRDNGSNLNIPWCNESRGACRQLQDSPFRSDLFLRVLYHIGSMGWQSQSNDSSKIQDQFLTEEQIIQNQLKQQLGGVERLKHDMANASDPSHSRNSNASSGTVTPVEFIYHSIPGIIKRNSFTSLKSEAGLNSSNTQLAEDKQDSRSLLRPTTEDSIDHHSDAIILRSIKSCHKLTGMEKSMLAPLTF